MSQNERQMSTNETKEVNQMLTKTRAERLPLEELEAHAVEPLPDRTAMSLVNANLAIPVNAAIAANVLSDGAIAYADATQQTPIDQGNLTGG